MKHRFQRVLAEGGCESICATTPQSRHRAPSPRFTWSAVIGWAFVAAVALIVLAMASVPPR